LPVIELSWSNRAAPLGLGVAASRVPQRALAHLPAPGGAQLVLDYDISLRHPRTRQPVRFRHVRDAAYYPGSRTWMGQVEPGSLDELVLTVTDEAVAGSLVVDGEPWRIGGTIDRLVVEPEWDEGECGAMEEAVSTSSLPLSRPQRPSPQGRQGFSTGPYAPEGLPVIDVLVVYGEESVVTAQPLSSGADPESWLRASTINKIALYDYMLGMSLVQGHVRMVGLRKIDWDSSFDVDSATGVRDFGGTRQSLAAVDSFGDEAITLREQTGADVVLGLVPPDAGGVFGLALIPSAPSASTTGIAYAVARIDAAPTTPGHELTHLLSVWHSRDEYVGSTSRCELNGGSNTQRYGHVYPNPWDTAPGDFQCATKKGFSSVMANTFDMTVNGVSYTPLDITRINRFANPDVTYSFPCGDGTFLGSTTGSSLANTSLVTDPMQSCSSTAAWRMSNTFPTVEAYRTPRASIDGADLVSPSRSLSLGTSATFSWTAAPEGSGKYWLEVYSPKTGAVWFDGQVNSSSSYVYKTVGGLPGTGETVGVRLWTEFWGGVSKYQEAWLYKEYRYNNAMQLVSCSDEVKGVMPDYHYANASCGGCSASGSSGLAYCSVAAWPNTHSGVATIVSNFVPGDAYDLAMWGTRGNGSDFCCLVHDPGDQISDVRLYGSAIPDELSFHDELTGYNLEPYGTQAITALLYGSSGDDVLRGSDSTSASYAETLKGYNGNDTIHAGNGDDDVYGGSGNDTLYGKAGNDLILTEGGADSASGGDGNDTVIALGVDRATLKGGTGHPSRTVLATPQVVFLGGEDEEGR